MSVIEATDEGLPSTQIEAFFAVVKRLIGFCEQLDYENNPREATAQFLSLVVLFLVIGYISQ